MALSRYLCNDKFPGWGEMGKWNFCQMIVSRDVKCVSILLLSLKSACEKNEDLDTGIETIDSIEENYAYSYVLTLDSALGTTTWTVGENVKQTLTDGTIMRGEISKYSDSDKKIHLVHVGADDGKFHSFAVGRNLYRSDSASNALVTALSEINKISQNEQNDDFDTTATDMSFLDFSETNPFGDPR